MSSRRKQKKGRGKVNERSEMKKKRGNLFSSSFLLRGSCCCIYLYIFKLEFNIWVSKSKANKQASKQAKSQQKKDDRKEKKFHGT